MRLISLTSNGSSFKTVRFRKEGVSLILGKQKPRDPNEKSDGKTYNGVGKSLLLYLINFCLAADPNESFTRQLAGWDFTLRVEIDGKEIPITRRVSEPDTINYAGESVTTKRFKERLEQQLFPEAKNQSYLTFRSLLGLFLRTGEFAYSVHDGIHFSEKPVAKTARCAYLLAPRCFTSSSKIQTHPAT